MTRDIHIADFDYPLPEERIASHPLEQRDACRLMVAAPGEEPREAVFSDLPDLLPADALLVANNARVINARILFHKETGAEIEVFLLEPAAPVDYALMFQANYPVMWHCLIGNAKKWKKGNLVKKLSIDGREVTLTATRGGEGSNHLVTLAWDDRDVPFARIVEAAGFIPIPPYLNRESESSDLSDYQTVYSRVNGSVAAPTAGLHFTPRLFARLESKGIERRFVTLHVGAGTFRPVKADTIGEHDMHAEAFSVSREFLADLIRCKKEGRPVVAVGTTTVRTLESLPYFGRMAARGLSARSLDQWTAYDNPLNDDDTVELLQALADRMDRDCENVFTAQTSIMIAPGFRWRVVDAIITNFHQPQSTLLLLVASFLEPEEQSPRLWRRIYDKALEEGFRFLSYGDACLLFH
ncbi:MAG: S-adenosylmethionine:tRNA ribosyltransferase-isomerase [Bacteroidales bacterium]|nr:S-adenosylmethionine:tRNA ribosyltransferase-isomerase [Bacteroidales bacterium]